MINHIKNTREIVTNFLNIELNNIFIQTKFFSNKLARIKNIIKNLLNKSIISHRKFEIAIRFLLFIIKIVVFEKMFLKRLFDIIYKSVFIIRIISIMKKNLI